MKHGEPPDYSAAEIDRAAAALATTRAETGAHCSLLARILVAAVFFGFNVLSAGVVRQGLLTLESFRHVAWFPAEWFESALAIGIQASLAFFCIIWPYRLKRVSLALAWSAALFAVAFWSAECWLGLLTQSLGAYAPQMIAQLEKRTARLQADVAGIAPEMGAAVERQISWNKEQADAEERGIGLTGQKKCREVCRFYLKRAMEIERRFGDLADAIDTPSATGPNDLNRSIVEVRAALSDVEQRLAAFREFANVAMVPDVAKAMDRRIAAAIEEQKKLTVLLARYPSISVKSIALDHASTILGALVRMDWDQLGPTEWTIAFYSTVLIAGNIFAGLLLAIQGRHASLLARKARRASELDAEARWDLELAESEERATKAGAFARVSREFWRRMRGDR